MIFTTMLFMLISGHCLADYPLQGDFLSRAKNRTAPIPGIPWKTAMGAHVMIHAGAVLLITNNIYLAFIESWVHWVVDDLKCRGKIGFNTDQAIHIICKFAYVGVLWGIS